MRLFQYPQLSNTALTPPFTLSTTPLISSPYVKSHFQILTSSSINDLSYSIPSGERVYISFWRTLRPCSSFKLINFCSIQSKILFCFSLAYVIIIIPDEICLNGNSKGYRMFLKAAILKLYLTLTRFKKSEEEQKKEETGTSKFIVEYIYRLRFK